VGGRVNLYLRRSSGGAEFENRDDQSIIPIATRISNYLPLLMYYSNLLLALLPEERYINLLNLHWQAL
jgi:hypothetical protein